MEKRYSPECNNSLDECTVRSSREAMHGGTARKAIIGGITLLSGSAPSLSKQACRNCLDASRLAATSSVMILSKQHSCDVPAGLSTLCRICLGATRRCLRHSPIMPVSYTHLTLP